MNTDQIIVTVTLLFVIIVIFMAACYGWYLTEKKNKNDKKYMIDIRENPNTIIISIKNPISQQPV